MSILIYAQQLCCFYFLYRLFIWTMKPYKNSTISWQYFQSQIQGWVLVYLVLSVDYHIGNNNLYTSTITSSYVNCDIITQIEVAADLYETSERHLQYNASGLLSFLGSFPTSAMTPEVVISSSAPGAIFYNITLSGLDIPLQAYTAHIYTKSCKDSSSGITQSYTTHTSRYRDLLSWYVISFVWQLPHTAD